MDINKSFFERKHGKLGYAKNLAPKIFPTIVAHDSNGHEYK